MFRFSMDKHVSSEEVFRTMETKWALICRFRMKDLKSLGHIMMKEGLVNFTGHVEVKRDKEKHE